MLLNALKIFLASASLFQCSGALSVGGTLRPAAHASGHSRREPDGVIQVGVEGVAGPSKAPYRSRVRHVEKKASEGQKKGTSHSQRYDIGIFHRLSTARFEERPGEIVQSVGHNPLSFP